MNMRLTEKSVARITPGDRDVFEWDDAMPGFGVRVKPSGAKSYIIQYRRGAVSKRMTIGSCALFRLEQARERARRLLSAAKDGGDPAAERDQARKAPSVSDLADRYLAEHAELRKKPSSFEADQRNIANHVRPLLGKLRVQDVTSEDIDQFLRDVQAGVTAKDEKLGKRSRRIVRGGAGVANRCVALLSKMLNLAERWRLRPLGSNPCRGLEKFKERKVERMLSTEELGRLGDALAAYDASRYAVAAIKLLAFTGARLGEVLSLRWDWIDFERGEARLPDSKTGAKTLHLPPPARAVLAELSRIEGNPHVIVGSREGAALVNLEKPWRAIRKEAGLDDVRLHDLRHAFASVAVSSGVGLPIIGKMHGQSQAATTARYAHLASDPVKAAAASVASKIASALGGTGAGASATVVRLRDPA
jgi:integrase